MSQVTYMAPVEEVRGKLTLNRGNDSVIVTRRKSYGKTKNGTPRLGPKEIHGLLLSLPTANFSKWRKSKPLPK